MMRHLLALALVALMGMAACTQARAQDRIYLKADPKKPLLGTIQKESAAGITLKLKTASELVPARSIHDVIYDAPGAIKLGYYNPAQNSEADIDKAATAAKRRDALDEAVKNWENLQEKLNGSDYDKLRRHAAYKLGVLKARQALERGLSPAPAVRQLKSFVQNNPDSWQVLAAARLLGQLLVDGKNFREAEQVFDELAGQTAMPQAARASFQLLAARALMQGQDFAAAQAKLQTILEKLPRTSPQRARAMVYQAECLAETNQFRAAEDKFNGVLDEARNDKHARALAYNGLGYCHYRQKLYKDALWDFLRVDVVYHQNKEEQARALYYLVELFTRLKDEDHARECRARLKDSPEFSGTEYQRLLLKDGK